MILAPVSHSGRPSFLADPRILFGRLLKQRLPFSRLSGAQREAALTVLCIITAFVAIVQFDLGSLTLGLVEHRPDFKRDALILAGLTMSIGLAVFAVRRWRELTREVAVRMAAEVRANVLAREDALTGLPNRRALLGELAAALARSGRSGEPVSLLLLDLDRFKPVNDVHGHVAGDRLLQAIAARLRANVRLGEFAARLGGDEFAVIVSHGCDEMGAAVAAAKRIAEALSQTVTLGSIDLHVGVSTGIATFPFDAEDAEVLMRRADVALYRAKESGRGRCQLFDAAMDAEIRERSAIETDLRQAIISGEVLPHFQPMVDLRSGRIVAFEALARWRHPDHGFIPPSRFIPIAEDSGLIGDLGMAILRLGCRHACRWGGDALLAVNISPIQLADRNLADKLLAVLEEEGLPAHRLEVELTENALVSDIEGARTILAQLKAAGVSISLDDFGAGYSSLRHLSSMPFDRVKIDRDFVQGLGASGDPLKIIRAIVGLCTSLGLACTGEGAETFEQVAMLRAAGCSVVQGWYFGEALPADRAAKLAAEGRVPLTRLHGTAQPDSVDGPVLASTMQSHQSPLASGSPGQS